MILLTNQENKFVIYVKKNLVPMMTMENTIRYDITVITLVNIGALFVIFVIL